MKWVIIGVIFMIVMVMFGRNAPEEARKRREDAARDPNAIVHAIEEHNSQKRTGGKLGSFLGGNAGTASPAVNMHNQYPVNNVPRQPPPATAYRRYQPQMAPDAAPAPNQAQDSYYPPPATSQGNAPYAPPPPGGVPHSKLGVELGNGLRVHSEGSNMYTVDANGRSKPLADGVYTLKNSAVVMVIRDGRKIAIQ